MSDCVNSAEASASAAGGPARDRERELLQSCLRAHCDPRRREALLNAAVQGIDWSRALDSARAARIGPIVHQVLAGTSVAPAAFLAALHTDYRVHTARNLFMLRELLPVLERLDAAGTAAVVLKGAALVEPLYGKIGLRPMHDVDLLVRRADVPALQEALAPLGWEPAAEWAGAAAAVREAQAESAGVGNNEMLFVKSDGRVRFPLEVHWRLFDPQHFQHRVDMEWFWQSARPATIAGQRALVLGDEAELLHLCGHLHLHHGGNQPLWLHDIALLVRRKGDAIDWPLVAARAREFDLVACVVETLRRIAADWHVELPEAARAVEGLQPSLAEREALDRIARPPRSELERLRGEVSGMSARQRWRFLRSSLFPSPEYMRERYGVRHSALLPLYYPYRWLRGAATVLRGRR